MASLRTGLGRGVALRGAVWAGGDAHVLPDGVVVVDGDGRVAALEPAGTRELPADLPVLGGPGSWVGPGVADAHVHLAFGDVDALLAGGVVAVRDLGAPPELRVATAGGPLVVRRAGPVLTAPGGYPSGSWGADGFWLPLPDPATARRVVRELVAQGVDLVKVAVEPAGGQPVPGRAELRAVVDEAHEAGLRVTAHALGVTAVERVLDAGVDELAHTPTEWLDDALVGRLAAAGTVVVSTLQTLIAQEDPSSAPVTARNAAALHAAGVVLVYGTDLGNAGTSSGVDPRELDRLADAGLGRLGALRAATEGSARLLALPGRVEVGEPAALVLLPADPLVQPEAWRASTAVVAGGSLVRSDSPV